MGYFVPGHAVVYGLVWCFCFASFAPGQTSVQPRWLVEPGALPVRALTKRFLQATTEGRGQRGPLGADDAKLFFFVAVAHFALYTSLTPITLWGALCIVMILI